ncbi:MAG: GldG family protein [Magnetococcus sp. DMHC-6]
MNMNPKNRFNLRLQNFIFGVLLTAILVVLALVSTRYQVRWDWTAGQRQSLASQSVQAVKAFNDKIRATVYVQEQGTQRQEAEKLLLRFQVVNPDLEIRYVDPDLDPAAARKEEVAMYGTVVLRHNEKVEKVTELTEEAMTNALIRLAKGSSKNLLIINGHGEHPMEPGPEAMQPGERGGSYKNAVTLLKGEGYKIASLNLAEVEKIPEDTSVVLLPGPRKPLFPVEVDRLKSWFDKGGRLLVMGDPGVQTGLEEMLKEYGITWKEGLVIDPVARLFGGGPSTPLVSQYDLEHPITKGFTTASFFPEARGLELAASPADSKQHRTRLLSGAERGWLETSSIESGSVAFDPQQDEKGPILLAAAVNDATSRLVVVGDSDFASDTYIDLSGNGDLFLNMVRWLAEDENFIALKPKKITDSGVTLQRGEMILLFWGLVAGIPLLLLGSGFTLWMRRKRR